MGGVRFCIRRLINTEVTRTDRYILLIVAENMSFFNFVALLNFLIPISSLTVEKSPKICRMRVRSAFKCIHMRFYYIN